MGRQVNFYATPLDANAILQHVATTLGGRCLAWEAGVSSVPKLEEITLPIEAARAYALLLARPADYQGLVFTRSPAQNTWFISQFKSPVVEARFRFVQSGELGPSRLWFQTDMVSPEFVKWGTSIFRWIRSQFKKAPNWEISQRLIAPDARRRVEAGEVILLLN